MLVNEISRSAISVWCQLPSSNKLLAVGSVGSSFNNNFESSSKLEIWNPLPQEFFANDSDSLISSVLVPENFSCLTWLPIQSNENPLGLIAGVLSSGSIGIWNPDTILNRKDDNACLYSSKAPPGPVVSMDFSLKQPNLIAFGCSNGELILWNLSNTKTPTFHRPGNVPPSQLNSKLTSVTFNPSYKHILASSSSNGNMVIWDLRQKSQALSFSINNSNKNFNVSCVHWSPDQPMKIAVSSDDEDCYDISLWDLSLNLAPVALLKGHARGVTSMSWSRKYSSMLLSTSRDLSTICWDMDTGTKICEVGYNSNWNTKVEWANEWANVFSTNSTDGKIRIYTLSDFENLATEESYRLAETKTSQNINKVQQQSFKEMEFINVVNATAQASNMNLITIIKNSRLLENGAKLPPISPHWLKKPCSVSFGFGGVITAFGISGIINQYHISTEEVLVDKADKLQEALVTNTLKSFCQKKILLPPSTALSSIPAGETWKTLHDLIEYSDCKLFAKKLLDTFELNSEKISQEIKVQVASDAKLSKPKLENEEPVLQAPQNIHLGQSNGGSIDSNDLSLSNELFGDEDDSSNEFFTLNLSSIQAHQQSLNSNTPQITSTHHMVCNKPIKFDSKDTYQNIITKLLLVGDLKCAVDYCIKFDRLDDALMLASLSDKNLLCYVRNVYLNKKKEHSSTAIMEALIGGNWSQFIERINLSYWQSSLSLIYNYVKDEEFYKYVKMLGQRLKEANDLRSAMLCFLCADSFNDLECLWVAEAKNLSYQNGSLNFSILQEYIEKCIIFLCNSSISNFQTTSFPKSFIECYELYVKFLINENAMQTALKYLSLIVNLTGFKSTDSAFSFLYDRVYSSLPVEEANNIVQNFNLCWANYSKACKNGELDMKDLSISLNASVDSSSNSFEKSAFGRNKQTTTGVSNGSFVDHLVASPTVGAPQNSKTLLQNSIEFSKSASDLSNPNFKYNFNNIPPTKPDLAKSMTHNIDQQKLLNVQNKNMPSTNLEPTNPVLLQPQANLRPETQFNKPGISIPGARKQPAYMFNTPDSNSSQLPPPRPVQSRIKTPVISTQNTNINFPSPSQNPNDLMLHSSQTGYVSPPVQSTQELLSKPVVPLSRPKMPSKIPSVQNDILANSPINASNRAIPPIPQSISAFNSPSAPETAQTSNGFGQTPNISASSQSSFQNASPSYPQPRVNDSDFVITPKRPDMLKVNFPPSSMSPSLVANQFSSNFKFPNAQSNTPTLVKPVTPANTPTFTPNATMPTPNSAFTPNATMSTPNSAFTPNATMPTPNSAFTPNATMSTPNSAFTPTANSSPSFNSIHSSSSSNNLAKPNNLATNSPILSREPSQSEVQAIKLLKNLLDKIDPEFLLDLPSRIDHLEQKIYTDSIEPSTPPLIEFTYAITQKDLAKAEQAIHEISRKAYKTVGSKTIIALNRILKIAKDGHLHV